MTVDELQVLITANTNELRKEIGNANKSIAGLQKSASKSTGGVASAFSKLKTGIIALGIGKVISDSINMGMDAIETDSLFNTVMGDNADAVKEWSNGIADTLGLSAVAMQKNIGVIYNMTSSMGVAGDNALKMSKGVSVLAEDMASFYNLDSTEAFNKIRAGLTGETEPLKALGILVDENTIKQYAYSEGIAQNGAELTNQQKVLARYVAILRQTGNAQGDLARTLDSPANQMRALKQNVANLGIAFSNILMPVVKAVLPYINAFTKVLTQAVNSLSSFLGLTGNDAAKGTATLSKNVGGVGAGLDTASKKAKKLKQSLAGFDEMNVLQDNSSDSDSGSGGGAGADLAYSLAEYDAQLGMVDSKTNQIAEKIKGAFATVGDYIKKIWNSEPVQAFVGAVVEYAETLWNYWSTLGADLVENVKNTWDKIKGNVGTYVSNMLELWTTFWTDIQAGLEEWGQPIIDGVSKLFNTLWLDIVDPVVQQITKIWADFSGILLDTWNKYGQPLIDKVGEFVVNIIALFQSLWDNILEPIVTPFLQMLSKVWDEYLKPLVATIVDFVAAFVDGALEIYNKFISPIVLWITEKLKPVFEFIGKIVSNVFGTMIAVVSSVITGIIGFFRGIIDFVVGVFTGNWQKAWNGIKTAFKNVFDSFVKIAKAVWNSIKGVFSATAEFFGKIWTGIKNVFSSVGSWFAGVFNKAWEGIKNAFSKVTGFFKGIWNSIKEIFSKVGSTIAGAISGAVKKAINAVLSTAVKIINGFISAINFAIGIINKIPGVEINKLSKLEVPQMARGGVVDRPTYAMIGEAGAEAVVPLERNLGYLDKLAGMLAEKIGGGNGNINLTVKLGEDTIFDKFIDYGRAKAFETNGEVAFA